MKLKAALWLIAALVVTVAGLTVTAYRAQNLSDQGVLKVGVSEVLLDLVVTDKKGRQIRDLTLDEIEVYEDGALQKIRSFRKVESAREERGPEAKSQADRKSTSPGTESSPETGRINLITMVFDRISTYGRRMARDAAREYFKQLSPMDFVSVMTIDRHLRVLQPFTNDAERLHAAVELATHGTPQQFADTSAALRDALQKAEDSQATAEASVSQVGAGTGPGLATGSGFAEAQANRMIADMMRISDVGDSTIQGRATVESLLNLIRAEHAHEGRKAVLFFAERVSLPTQVVARFRDLISAANRANVSFYCFDTSGLHSAGELTQMSNELRALASVSVQQQTRRGGRVSREEVTLAENADNALRLSAQNSLLDLATSTGGQFITNTNDFRKGLSSALDDLHSHYELTYAPSNQDYNGEFRQVEIKLKRPDSIVHSRRGYYAVRSDDVAVSSFEIPLLFALDSKSLPRDIPFHNASLLYPTREVRSEVVLYLEVPLSSFEFQVDNKSNEYEGRIAVLAQLKNAQGRTVQKFSQEFPLRGPSAGLKETRNRNLIFYRTAELVPGRYTLEAVVRDDISARTSVKRSIVSIPARDRNALALSSVVVVRRLDSSRSELNDADNPLTVSGKLVVPHLTPEFKNQNGEQLAFYFVAVPATGSGVVYPQVDLIISKDGKPVGRMGEKPLPEPDHEGRVRYLASVPASSLGIGNYDVNVVVRQGGAVATSSALFSIQ
ncbi:MAG: VWA domain-containing protein [Acidobacteriota bacterium]